MTRTVTAHLQLEAAGPADVLLCLAVATGGHAVTENLTVTGESGGLPLEVVTTRHGTRVHRLAARAGRIDVAYRAVVEGRAAAPPVAPADLVEYLLPSRYAESDKLVAFAADQFSAYTGRALLDAVVSWVADHIAYVPGSSGPTDGAIDSLLTRSGVCRDFAHLVIGLLRARSMPARMVSVYAPGLSPMDFHAVAEAHVDGGWHVVDATRLAPRGTLLRIATGRDAADTAFMSAYGGDVALQTIEVTATSDGPLPGDAGGLAVLG